MRQNCAWIGVAFFAVICYAFGSQECEEDTLIECRDKLLYAVFGDFTDEEACKQLYGVIQCLRNCLGEEEEPHIKQAFKGYMDDRCAEAPGGDSGDEEEVRKCLDKNQAYLLECINDGDTGDISQLLQPESNPADIDPEFRQCYFYGLMSHCVVGRSEERCGVAGGKMAADMLSDAPLSVQESCDSQQDNVEDYVKGILRHQSPGPEKGEGLRIERTVVRRRGRQDWRWPVPEGSHEPIIIHL